jgi:cytoskeletal protein CcmA (bactofilin family)
MWNRRKEEESLPRPVSAPPTPSELSREGIPMSTLPGRTSESHDSVKGQAVLGKSVLVKGSILSREDLTIDGEVEGAVDLSEHRLTVGPNARIKANIQARELVVLGTIHGNVEITDRIDIRRDAKLVGDIRTARIVIEDGAYFKGNIDIVKAEPPKAPAAKPAPEPEAAPAPPAAMAAKAGEPKR